MPATKTGFNRVLDDLARRQLHLDFEFGTAAEKYEPVRSIGAGAFGIVCEAEETTSDGNVTKKSKICFVRFFLNFLSSYAEPCSEYSRGEGENIRTLFFAL
ncbi:unnamed protein product [Cylicostephanus goldi]|uniref:Protein kinase domain-containing protein n=1 Tax=Cylicostephanus goldi TaxID=71465 RepID=A0A3P6QPT3_CYLGO|nr:unnamed protein product [Cylicostephanus goldi]